LDPPDGTAIEKSAPVPPRLTVCVLPVVPLLLSVMVSVPLAEPVAVGVKVTLIVQEPDAATGLEVEQVVPLVATAKGVLAVIAIEAMVRPTPPVLLNVTVCAALVVLSN
jgi:hypothetical protein